MNISLESEKTTFLKMDEKSIKVSSLPEPIRFEVDTLDRFLQKRLNLLQELEIIELAIKAKQAHLRQIVEQLPVDKET